MSDYNLKIPSDIIKPVCRICGKGPTIRSHLLPEAFVKEIYFGDDTNEKHMIVHNQKRYKEASNTGRFERGVLCKDCDNTLGKYENSTITLFRRLRPVKIGKLKNDEVYIPRKVYPFKHISGDEIIRFACGILWKYASIPENYPAHIKIGKYKDIFENICFKGAPIPDGVDAFLERDISAHAHGVDPIEVYYYSTPSVYSVGGRRMGWFNAGGFFVYVLMDEQGPSDFVTRQCWLKGRRSCYFNVNIRALQHYQEIAESMQMAQSDLAKLNKKVEIPARFKR